jgi:hypothetical protein
MLPDWAGDPIPPEKEALIFTDAYVGTVFNQRTSNPKVK